MILPDKYVSIEQSLIGVSAFILDVMGKDEITIEKLWTKFNKKYVKNSKTKLKEHPSFQKFVITLNFMYATNMLNYDVERNVLFNENIRA